MILHLKNVIIVKMKELLKELEHWKKSGIIVTNQEISEQYKNLPKDIKGDDAFNLCVILAMKQKQNE